MLPFVTWSHEAKTYMDTFDGSVLKASGQCLCKHMIAVVVSVDAIIVLSAIFHFARRV